MTKYKYSNFGDFEDEFAADVLLVNDKAQIVTEKVGEYIDKFVVQIIADFTAGSYFSVSANRENKIELWAGFPAMPNDMPHSYPTVLLADVLNESLEEFDESEAAMVMSLLLAEYAKKFAALSAQITSDDK